MIYVYNRDKVESEALQLVSPKKTMKFKIVAIYLGQVKFGVTNSFTDL